jgi:hypothetical protein
MADATASCGSNTRINSSARYRIVLLQRQVDPRIRIGSDADRLCQPSVVLNLMPIGFVRGDAVVGIVTALLRRAETYGVSGAPECAINRADAQPLVGVDQQIESRQKTRVGQNPVIVNRFRLS